MAIIGTVRADDRAATDGRDPILGLFGGDRLDKLEGDDTILGGPGGDTFVFGFQGLPSRFSPQEDTGTGEGRRSVMVNSQRGQDRLYLTGYGPALVRALANGEPACKRPWLGQPRRAAPAPAPAPAPAR